MVGGKGGDVRFIGGKGSLGGADGSIVFLSADEKEEYLRLSSDGFFVRGAPVPRDQFECLAVFFAFRLWMKEAGIELPNKSDQLPWNHLAADDE